MEDLQEVFQTYNTWGQTGGLLWKDQMLRKVQDFLVVPDQIFETERPKYEEWTMDEETGYPGYIDVKPTAEFFDPDWEWREQNQYIKDEIIAFLVDFNLLKGEMVEAIFYRPSPDGVNAWVEIVMFRGRTADIMLERARVSDLNPYLKFHLKQKVKVKQPPRRNQPKAKAKSAAGKGNAKGKGKNGQKGAQPAAPAAPANNNQQYGVAPGGFPNGGW